MTLYALILFAHIAGAFFLFGGLALEWLAISYLRKSLDRSLADSWIHLARMAQRFYGPALGVVLFSGAYLAAKMGGRQGWIAVSLATLLVIGFIGLIFTTPRMRRIGKAASEAGESWAAVQNLVQSPVLPASVRLRLALVFGVLLLMASKVNLDLSVITITGAAAVGAFAAILGWRRPAIHQARPAA